MSRLRKKEISLKIGGLLLLIFAIFWNIFYPRFPQYRHFIQHLHVRLFAPEADEFPDQTKWLNTQEPPKLSQLRGKYVLLYFWRYSFTECLDDLKNLSAIQSDELTILTVHSPKFRAEHNAENLIHAIRRFEIKFPVAVDSNSYLKKLYGIDRRPAVVLIDPLGRIIFRKMGNVDVDQLESFFDTQARMVASPKDPVSDSLAVELNYPREVFADSNGQRLFISDSGNNRILMTDFSGEIIEVIGGAESALADGNYQTAAFSDPQGLFLKGEKLYVADRGNHAIRIIDLTKKVVQTLVGTGMTRKERLLWGKGKSLELNYPADVVVVGNQLYATMAGAHQIWEINLDSLQSRAFAGTELSKLVNGPRNRAGLAEPNGLTADADNLYFLDSDASALRVAEIKPLGWVKTLVGTIARGFGDRDGGFSSARLQNPRDLILVDQRFYIADTLNNKIKMADLNSELITTISGSGACGNLDAGALNASFNSPEGISYADGKLFIADTMNHQIRVVDLASKSVSTLQLHPKELPQAEIEYIDDEFTVNGPTSNKINLLRINLAFPPGYKFLPEAPSIVTLKSQASKIEKEFELSNVSQEFLVSIEFPDSDLTVDLDLHYCREGEVGLCLIRKVRFLIPLVEDSEPQNVNLEYRVPEAPF
jgi:DNA-binding beta-propeller fold protein YncE